MPLPKLADVIVIGAGVAGLSAARELLKAGVNVVVLEARPRVGGRICTIHAGHDAIELGAEFIHGTAPQLDEALEHAGIAALDITGVRWLAANGVLKPLDDFWERLARAMRPLRKPRKRDRSVAEVLDRRRGRGRSLDRRLALQFVEGFNAADAHLISAQAVAAANPAYDPEERRLGRVHGGYDRLVNWLASPVRDRIHSSTIVTGVQWKKGSVRVEVNGGRQAHTVAARATVVAVPLGVLKAAAGETGAIAFAPPLEQKQDALEHLAMGTVVRVSLRFRERFWVADRFVELMNGSEPNALSFIHSPDEEFPVWWTAYPIRTPVIVGWCGGPRARDLSALSSAEIVQRAVGALARSLRIGPRRLRGLLGGAWTHDWEHDPFSRGAYSYEMAGGANAPANLARPLQGTLFFAGEASDAEGATGTVHGAMNSGRRAASEVLRILR